MSRNLRAPLIPGFILFCGIAPVVLTLTPRPGEPVAVVTLMPDAALSAAIAVTDARIIWASSQGRIVILSAASSDLVATLYRGGATLVIAAALLAGCGPTTVSTTSPVGTRSL